MTVSVKLHEDTNNFRIERGNAKSGKEKNYPKLFRTEIDYAFKQLILAKRCKIVDGEYLNNLRYADDIDVPSGNREEAQQMCLQNWKKCQKTVHLDMNF